MNLCNLSETENYDKSNSYVVTNRKKMLRISICSKKCSDQ